MVCDAPAPGLTGLAGPAGAASRAALHDGAAAVVLAAADFAADERVMMERGRCERW